MSFTEDDLSSEDIIGLEDFGGCDGDISGAAVVEPTCPDVAAYEKCFPKVQVNTWILLMM